MFTIIRDPKSAHGSLSYLLSQAAGVAPYPMWHWVGYNHPDATLDKPDRLRTSYETQPKGPEGRK
jgi:hypothetical protein